MASERVKNLASVRKQHLLVELCVGGSVRPWQANGQLNIAGLPSASLKYAGLQGIYMSVTPGNPRSWSGIIFVREGPYASAVLRLEVFFPVTYPTRPPRIALATEIFHPLVTPSTTYTHAVASADKEASVSNKDDHRSPPGTFSLKHGFPQWVGGREQDAARSSLASLRVDEGLEGSRSSGAPGEQTPDAMAVTSPTTSLASFTDGRGASTSSIATVDPGPAPPSIVDVLRYVRSTFDTEAVIDSIPLETAANSSAWHAWQAHRGRGGPRERSRLEKLVAEDRSDGAPGSPSGGLRLAGGKNARRGRSPADWNWEGVWEERARRGILNSMADSVLFGNAGGSKESIQFLDMEPEMLETVKEDIVSSTTMINTA